MAAGARGWARTTAWGGEDAVGRRVVKWIGLKAGLVD